MARFDVYRHPDAAQRERTPFLLDVQNPFLSMLGSRIVVPLRALDQTPQPLRDLNPIITVLGQAVVLDCAALAAVPSQWLRQPVGSAADSASLVTHALDTLLGGY